MQDVEWRPTGDGLQQRQVVLDTPATILIDRQYVGAGPASGGEENAARASFRGERLHDHIQRGTQRSGIVVKRDLDRLRPIADQILGNRERGKDRLREVRGAL